MKSIKSQNLKQTISNKKKLLSPSDKLSQGYKVILILLRGKHELKEQAKCA